MKNDNTLGNCDLLSLDINKMVNGINEQKKADSLNGDVTDTVDVSENERTEVPDGVVSTAEDASAEDETQQELSTETPAESELWMAFMQNLRENATGTRKKNRKSYWVDEDIANTFKSCDFERSSLSDIINAVLRSFISLNKESLRKLKKNREVLI